MTAVPSGTAAADGTGGAGRTVATGRAAPQLIAALSLFATGAMWAGYPVVPPLLWLITLIAVAIVCSIAARHNPEVTAPHLAVEPLAMAAMVTYGLFHAQGVGAGGDAHAAHTAWILPAFAVALAALAVVCPVLAVRHLRRAGVVAGALPVVASAAMAVMAGWMLVPR